MHSREFPIGLPIFILYLYLSLEMGVEKIVHEKLEP